MPSPTETSIRGSIAICGLGVTPMGKIYDRDARDFAAEAIQLALADAGLVKTDLDGLLINAGIGPAGAINLQLQNQLGLHDLRLLNHMNAQGATAASMVQYAALAVHHGMANYVACVFADAPLREGRSAGAAYGGAGAGRGGPTGIASLTSAYGFFGANTGYALAAPTWTSMASPATSSAPSLSLSASGR